MTNQFQENHQKRLLSAQTENFITLKILFFHFPLSVKNRGFFFPCFTSTPKANLNQRRRRALCIARWTKSLSGTYFLDGDYTTTSDSVLLSRPRDVIHSGSSPSMHLGSAHPSLVVWDGNWDRPPSSVSSFMCRRRRRRRRKDETHPVGEVGRTREGSEARPAAFSRIKRDWFSPPSLPSQHKLVPVLYVGMEWEKAHRRRAHSLSAGQFRDHIMIGRSQFALKRWRGTLTGYP